MKPFLLALLTLLGGCSASYTEPTLPADHPANPAALEAPPPTRRRALDLAAADPVTPAKAGAGMDHEKPGHRMGEMPPGTPSGGDHIGHKHGAPSGAAQQEATPSAAVMYACPMHPEVTSDKPDQRCPKCGMKLKPVSKSGDKR